MADIPDIFTFSTGLTQQNQAEANKRNAEILRNPHHLQEKVNVKSKSPSAAIECEDLPTPAERLAFSKKAALIAAGSRVKDKNNDVLTKGPPLPPPPPPLPPRKGVKVRAPAPPAIPPPILLDASKLEQNSGSSESLINKRNESSKENSNHTPSEKVMMPPAYQKKARRPKSKPRHEKLHLEIDMSQPLASRVGAADFVTPLNVTDPLMPYVIEIPPPVDEAAPTTTTTTQVATRPSAIHQKLRFQASVADNTRQSQIRQRSNKRLITNKSRMDERRTSLISMRNTKPISLEFKNMTFSIWEGKGKSKKEKQILKGIHGTFEGGQLHCIMGPSGSGKTTLLNTLAGFNAKAAKALMVRIGNYKIEASKAFGAGNKFFCYITQDIELPAFLTVRETMSFATRLKMPKLPRGVSIEEFVLSLVGPLGLKSSLDTFVNNLSGGQRKRLAIATEIINYPPVLFADEPTSGLDSAMAEECIELFKQMADRGCNIITTIHQPSAKVFALFNTLYCISRGECIYEGPTEEVLPRLNAINLTPPPFYSAADYILDIALGEASEKKLRELIDRTRQIQMGEAMTDDGDNKNKAVEVRRRMGGHFNGNGKDVKIVQSTAEIDAMSSFKSSNASFWSQTAALSERVLKTTCRNHMLFLFRISGLIAVGVLMGGIFWQDSKTSTPQILAILSSALFTSSFMPAVMGIPLDVKFMTTEYLNSWYQIPALALSSALTDCLLEIAHPLLFTVILWKMANLRDDDIRMLRSGLISILSAWNGRSVGIVAGTFSSRMTSAYVAFGGMAPFFVFTGSVLPYNLAPPYLQWLFYANSCFYVFEGHLQQVYGNNYFHPAWNETLCENPISVTCIEQRQNYDGKFVIEQAFGFQDKEEYYWKDVGILFGYFLLMRIIGSFTLYWRLKRELRRANNR